MIATFYALFFKSAILAIEAQQVMALRMLRLAGGGALAQRELQRMAGEKLTAAGEVGAKAALAYAGGKSGESIAGASLRDYRARVRKNRRRLTRGKRHGR